MQEEPMVPLNIILSAAAVIGLIIFWVILNNIYNKLKDRKDFSEGRKRNTLRLIFAIIKTIIVIVTILFVLQLNNINVSSLIASFGITGAVLGLAIQDLLRDYIMGYTIMASHYFSVGDTVKYGDFEGTVIFLDLRMTKIQSIDDYSILSISNRNLDQIIRVSHLNDIDIPLPYDADFELCRRTVRMIALKITEIDGIERAEFKGTQNFGDSAITYKLRFFCRPDSKRQLRREVNYVIQKELKAAGLAVPFKQVVIHNAKNEENKK